MTYYVYILKSLKNGKHYIGSTNNLADRLKRHNEGRSKYTKSGMPWELLYSEQHPDRSNAVKRENEIKKRKNKEYVEKLVNSSRHK